MLTRLLHWEKQAHGVPSLVSPIWEAKGKPCALPSQRNPSISTVKITTVSQGGCVSKSQV